MKWLRLLPLACVLPLQAETVVIPNLTKTPQERPLWCWAAVSSIAISAFPEGQGFKHLNQVQVAARRFAKAETLADERDKADKIRQKFDECKQPGACNEGKQPLLFDIEGRMLKNGGASALTMEGFKFDINRKRPVIIRWSFTDTSVAADAASGTHALIVTGFSTNPDMLLVYDPLPLRSKATSPAIPVVHETWIPYGKYLNASNQNGFKIVPLHEYDTFLMRRRSEDAQVLNPVFLVNVTPPAQRRRQPPGGFQEPGAFEAINQGYIDQRQKTGGGFLYPDGKKRTGNIKPGGSIPVVAVEARTIFGPGARPPESLLEPRASAYLVPVFEGTQIVDSFMVLQDENDMWGEGGYSSPGITSLLALLAADPKNRAQLKTVDGERKAKDDFYLVSVAELGSYFLAHGFGAEARLKSLDDDGAGEFLKPSKAFEPLIETLRRIAANRKADPPVTPR